MIDFPTVKAIVIPEGNVTQITCGGVTLWKRGGENLADQTSADWLTDKRINSSKNIVSAAGVDITNFIAIDDETETIHIKGFDILSALSSGLNYGRIYTYDEDKNYLSYIQPSTQPELFPSADYDENVCVVNWPGVCSTFKYQVADAAFIRFGGIPVSSNITITINEEA